MPILLQWRGLPVLAPRTSRFALADEYSAQQQRQGTGTNDEPTPMTRRVHGYHPGFPSLFSPAVCAVSTPLRRRPRCTCPPHWHRLARSLQTLHRVPHIYCSRCCSPPKRAINDRIVRGYQPQWWIQDLQATREATLAPAPWSHRQQ